MKVIFNTMIDAEPVQVTAYVERDPGVFIENNQPVYRAEFMVDVVRVMRQAKEVDLFSIPDEDYERIKLEATQKLT